MRSLMSPTHLVDIKGALHGAKILLSRRSWVRSPPPLPTILLIGRDLAKTRGGKRGQISPMIRFVREFSAARVTAGFLGTWVSPSHSPQQGSLCAHKT